MERTHDLIRWSGFCCLLASILFPLYTILHPVGHSPSVILESSWAAIHSLWFLGTILTLLGLMGLYARQVEETGRLATAGVLLVFVGMLPLLSLMFFDSYIVPILAANRPELLDPHGPLMAAPELMVTGVLSTTVVALGYLLFGIATMRAGVLPRWGGLLLAVGGLAFLFGQALGPMIATVCAAIFAVGLA
jgi:hypothetical protein